MLIQQQKNGIVGGLQSNDNSQILRAVSGESFEIEVGGDVEIDDDNNDSRSKVMTFHDIVESSRRRFVLRPKTNDVNKVSDICVFF